MWVKLNPPSEITRLSCYWFFNLHQMRNFLKVGTNDVQGHLYNLKHTLFFPRCTCDHWWCIRWIISSSSSIFSIITLLCRPSNLHEVTHKSKHFLWFFEQKSGFVIDKLPFGQQLVNKCWLKCWPTQRSSFEGYFTYLSFCCTTNIYFYILHYVSSIEIPGFNTAKDFERRN